MNGKHPSLERHGRIAMVRFGRGDGRNAMSRELIGELVVGARISEHDAETSAIARAGEGGNVRHGFDLGDAQADDADPGLAP